MKLPQFLSQLQFQLRLRLTPPIAAINIFPILDPPMAGQGPAQASTSNLAESPRELGPHSHDLFDGWTALNAIEQFLGYTLKLQLAGAAEVEGGCGDDGGAGGTAGGGGGGPPDKQNDGGGGGGLGDRSSVGGGAEGAATGGDGGEGGGGGEGGHGSGGGVWGSGGVGDGAHSGGNGIGYGGYGWDIGKGFKSGKDGKDDEDGEGCRISILVMMKLLLHG